MEDSFYPRYTMPARFLPAENIIRFLTPQGDYYDVSSHQDLIWTILEACTGHRPLHAIILDVEKVSQTDRVLIEEIIDDLTRLGVITDSRTAYVDFHTLTHNPPYFYTAMSKERVVALQKEIPTAGQPGKSYVLSGEHSTPLTQVLRGRRSTRNFTNKRLAPKLLAHLLIESYSPHLHVTPSAGGLYPLKLYLILTKSHGALPPGYYEFNPHERTLTLYNEHFDGLQLRYALNSESLLFGAPAVVVIAADLERQPLKYSNRGYRYTLLEAGHVAQNIHLIAKELGLATLEYGGFLDDELAREIEIPVPKIQPLIALAVGYASKIDTRVREQDQLLSTLYACLVGKDKPIKGVDIIRVRNGDAVPPDNVLARSNDQSDSPVGFGIATSATSAQIKAIAEAYEHITTCNVRVDYTATAKELRKTGRAWLDPRKLAPLTNSQYARLDYLQPFKENTTWQWVRGEKTFSGEPIWLPIDLVYLRVPAKQMGHKPSLRATSSGVAAYTDEQGALKLGLLELIERHAIMTAWYNHTAPKQIPTHLLPYHWQKRVELLRKNGRTVHILYQQVHQVSVTTVVVVSDTYPLFVSGAGASFDSLNESLGKAFREAELMLASMTTTEPPHPMQPEQVKTLHDHIQFYNSATNLNKLQWLWSGKPVSSVSEPSVNITALLAQLEVVSVQLTSEDAPLKVVRVMSEHLVPLSFGYGNEYYTHPALEHRSKPPQYPHYLA